MDFVESTVEADGERLACTVVEPSAPQPSASALPLAPQPSASALPLAPQPSASALPSAPQPSASALPLAPQPSASALPLAPQPSASALPLAPQPSASALPLAPQPSASALPLAPQPSASALPLAPQPSASALPLAPQPSASALPLAPQPSASALPLAPQPSASALPLAPQPSASALPLAPQPSASALPLAPQPSASALPLAPQPSASALPLAPQPSASALPLTALLMHGAGSGDRHRCLPLARELAAAGCRAVVFDFAGHGASSGTLGELSLARRARQARAVLERHAPVGPLLLVGFSMGGQTVTDLLRMPELAVRTEAVALCAPAAYAREVRELPFANPEFTKVLRQEGSWRSSTAFDTLAAFGGRAVLVLPETDGVIPAGVTDALDAALRTRPAAPPYARLTLPGADHLLGRWLGEHPEECERVAAALLGAG
ncbi:alpha/beta fold hydrolase [Kitasatospora sp. NA04385]|uniref:alpha/beta fold hydrolase n=1 Tax=Kitasatospora sp. NA04385 TaxID=2742135 RepID=UPI001591B57E|nr:alpha/beta fold hydrolase [Kitasatospora sp. NA04385]QKW21385.1 alpha/beta fold hydrolase [Kitasatospora sp. NA04385]